jgi:hypothetical protein
LKRETDIVTDIFQSIKMPLNLIEIAASVKVLMSVRHVKVVANAVLHPSQLIAKIVATTSRNRTNKHDVIESNQCVDLIPKILVSKIRSGDKSYT